MRDELKAAKIKIKALERDTGDKKDVKVLRDKFHEVLTAKETQEIEIFDLKEQISIENVNAYALQEQIKSSKTTIKDLQDEVDSKDLIIENISLGKTEILKSSSSSLADELDFADMQIRKANIQSLKPRRRKPRYHKYFQRPYSGSQNLKRHPVHAHKGNALKCKTCEKTFLSEQDLENHIKFVHYEIYKCSHRVLNNRALEKPDNNIVIKELKCHHCKITFKTKSSMKRHRKIRKVLQKENIHKIELKSYPSKSGPIYPSNMCKVDFKPIKFLDNHTDDNDLYTLKIDNEDVKFEGDSVAVTESQKMGHQGQFWPLRNVNKFRSYLFPKVCEGTLPRKNMVTEIN